MSRRAFIAGAVGAAIAGLAWWRERSPSLEPEAAPSSSTTVTTATPSSTTSAVPVTSVSTTTTSTTTTSTTAAPAVRIEALCRDAWKAAAPTGGFRDHEIERMTVHHTARLLRSNRGAPAAIRGHQRFHQLDRGWSDLAYHFVIDLEGNVYEARPTSAVGDTGTNYDPTGHFLVACEGNFSEQELPAAMEAALIDVLAWASEEFGVGAETIKGHRDVASTSCPGEELYALIASGDLAAAVAARVRAGGVELEIVCGEPAQERIAVIEA